MRAARRNGPGCATIGDPMDYRGGAFHKREGLRIDLLLATPRAARRVAAIEIDRGEYPKEGRARRLGPRAGLRGPAVMGLQREMRETS